MKTDLKKKKIISWFVFLPVDVVFPIHGKIIVDDQGNLLDINTTSQQVSGDQHTAGTGTELFHNEVTLLLIHVSMLKDKISRK